MSETYREIERTYELPDGADIPDLVGIGAVRDAVREDAIELDATYWDTDRYDLVASRVTARRRTGGADAGWHIKRGLSDTERQEQHFALTEDPSAVPDELLDTLVIERRGRRLQPVLQITTHRTITRLLGANGEDIAEIADDVVTARRLDAAAGSPARWREVEVEVSAATGSAAAHQFLGEVDRRFAEAGGAPAAVASKLARGLDGVDARRLRTTERPAKGTAARAITKRLRKLRDSLLDQTARVMSDSAADLQALAASALGIAAVLSSYREAFPDTAAAVRATEAADTLAVVASRAALAQRLVGSLHRASTPAQDSLISAEARERIEAGTRARAAEERATLLAVIRSSGFATLLDVADDAAERPVTTPWGGRAPKRVAQDVSGTVKQHLRELVRRAVGDDPSDEDGDRAATEAAWLAAMRARMVMDVLGDDAFPHALWKRVGAAAEVLTDRVESLHALERLRGLSAAASAAGESTFAYGVLAGDRVRIAEESYDEAVRVLNRV